MARAITGKGLNQYVNIFGISPAEEREIAVAARAAGMKNAQSFCRRALRLATENPEKVNPPKPVLPMELGGYRGYGSPRRGGIETNDPVRREIARMRADRRRGAEAEKIEPPSFDFRGQGERNRAEKALAESGFELRGGKWTAAADGLKIAVSVYDDGTAAIETTTAGETFASTTSIDKMIERITAARETLQ